MPALFMLLVVLCWLAAPHTTRLQLDVPSAGVVRCLSWNTSAPIGCNQANAALRHLDLLARELVDSRAASGSCQKGAAEADAAQEAEAAQMGRRVMQLQLNVTRPWRHAMRP